MTRKIDPYDDPFASEWDPTLAIALTAALQAEERATAARALLDNCTTQNALAENLVATAAARSGAPRWTFERVYTFFPQLAERRRNMATQLSGGEQQMLALGRALVLNPKIVLLDEPLEGLAPIICDELLAALKRITREEGISAILVEQNAQKVLDVTDRAIILERGAVVYSGDSAALGNDRQVLEKYIGVSEGAPRRHGQSRRSH